MRKNKQATVLHCASAILLGLVICFFIARTDLFDEWGPTALTTLPSETAQSVVHSTCSTVPVNTAEPPIYQEQITADFDIPQYGSFQTFIEKVNPTIRKHLEQGGFWMICDIPFPDTPTKFYSYSILESLPIQYDRIIQTIFGESCIYTLEPDAIGYHFEINNETGSYMGVIQENLRFSIRRMDHRDDTGSYNEETAYAIATQLLKLTECTVYCPEYENRYLLTTSDYQLFFPAKVDDIPISDRSYSPPYEDAAIQGTFLSIDYDSYGLSKVEIQQPIRLGARTLVENALISAQDAYDIVTKRMRGANLNAVQVFQDIQLIYLLPNEVGKGLVPAWAFTYDFYTLSTSPEYVNASLGEYQYLVDAISGQIYTLH